MSGLPAEQIDGVKRSYGYLEGSRLILWSDQWQRVERVAAALRHEHPESFRLYSVGQNLGTI